MTRCSFCNKQTSIVLDCLCKKKFCTSHLQPEIHLCEQLAEFISKDKIHNSKQFIESKKQIVQTI